ncbi:hypothetical protein AQV86_05440 [Nanohaloarchaea archaeon SG9]|nr:hypothetical protein AQV86_05440 [Nanohaloarchaea archaeon SG9]
MRFGSVQSELAELLDTEFLPGENDQITDYMRDVAEETIRLHNAGEYERRDYNLLRLKMFAKHLSEVKSTREELFDEFREELKKEDYDNYFGTRFEIDVAASLIRKDIDFEHPDPPDFDVQDKNVDIECQSSHFSGGDRTIEEKIKQTIGSKSGKDYYNQSNALFVDMTNIYFSSADRDEDISREKVKKWVRENFEVFDRKIGSLVLFTYVADASSGNSRLHHSYLRFDNYENKPKEELVEFLDQHWPKGNEHFPKTFFPVEP